MIVVSDKMENAVHYHPVQFVFELGAVEGSVVADGIYADEKIPGELAPLAIVEGYYVGEVVVLKVLHVDIEYVVVGTEDDADIAERADFALGDELEPLVVQQLVLELEVDIFLIVPDHNGINIGTANLRKLKIYSFMEEKKSLLFLEIGFLIALFFVYASIEYSTKSTRVNTLKTDIGNEITENDYPPITMDTPPPSPIPQIPKLSDIINIVDDELEVDDVQLILEDGSNLEVDLYDYVEKVEEENIDDGTIPYVKVEEKPNFMGGDANTFSKWVNERLHYPESAIDSGIQGRVILQFVVGKDGYLHDIKVLRGVDPLLDKEAVRVVQSSPAWTPGRQQDRKVNVTYTFPVIFRLQY